MDLAAEDGVATITAQAIADKVGIAQPTVFRHFRTRDLILQAVIDWIAEHLLGMVGKIAAGTGQPEERLRRLIDQQLKFIVRHRGLPRLLFSERLHQENTRLKQSVRKIMDAYCTLVAGVLREGVETGAFRAELDADETARLMLALIQGLVMRWSISDFEFDLTGEAPALWRLLEPALLRT